MFIESYIKDELKNLVGWKNNTLPDFVLDSENKESESGLFFNDSNPIVNLENIYYTAKPENMDDAKFNKYLEDLKGAAVLKVISDIFIDKNTFIEQRGTRINSSKSTKDLAAKVGQSVGFEIQVNSFDFIIKINSVEFYSKTNQAFKLKLINTLRSAPLKEWDIVLGAGNSKKEKIDFIINAKEGGRWFLVVDESELTDDIFCFDTREQMLGLVDVFNMTFQNSDIEKIDYTNEGRLFSIDYSVYKDYTTFIIDNKNLFASPIQLAASIMVLNVLFSTTRSNMIQRLGSEITSQAYELLNGGETKKGFFAEYENAIERKRNEIFKKRAIFKSTLKAMSKTDFYRW